MPSFCSFLLPDKSVRHQFQILKKKKKIVLRREALRSEAPTRAREETKEGDNKPPPQVVDPPDATLALGPLKRVLFWRGVPPFKWGRRDGGPWTGRTTRWSAEAANAHGAGAASQPCCLSFEDPEEVSSSSSFFKIEF